MRTCNGCQRIKPVTIEDADGCEICVKRIKSTSSMLKSLLKNPYKKMAQLAAAYARACGEIIAFPCEDCGDKNVLGHHDSYLEENWLIVRWLCASCHGLWHSKRVYNPDTRGYDLCR